MLLFVPQDTGLSESMEIDHNSSANFDEVNVFLHCAPIVSRSSRGFAWSNSRLFCAADVLTSDALRDQGQPLSREAGYGSGKQGQL